MRILICPAIVVLLVSGCAREQTSTAHYQDFPGAGSSTSAASSASLTAATATTTTPPDPGTGQKLIVTPTTDGLNGRVSRVNPNLRFVVLTFPVGQMPGVNRRLNLYRQGLKVGEVNITGPQRNDSIVADLTAGEAEAGDEARDK